MISKDTRYNKGYMMNEDPSVEPPTSTESTTKPVVPIMSQDPGMLAGSKRLSVGAIVGLVVGIAAIAGVVAYFVIQDKRSPSSLPDAPASYEWYKNDKIAFLHLSKWEKESPLGTQIPVGNAAKFNQEFTYVGTFSGAGSPGIQHYHSVINTSPSIGADAAAERGYRALEAASSGQLMSLTQYSGHDSFMCASNFSYVDPLKRVKDATSGKNGLEFMYSCDNADKHALKGAFGAYYDADATLHVMYIATTTSSWDKNKARVTEMMDSVVLKP